jgi:hypothetical protein
MKQSILILSLVLSFSAMAKDMSKTETYEEAYKEVNGYSVYVGACSLHPDREAYTTDKTLVEYFEPGYESTMEEFMSKVKNLDKELIDAAQVVVEGLPDVDDFTATKITSTKAHGLDLYSLNIGVGGGNGMILTFNKTVKNGKVHYELMSDIMDGDVNFCDSKVWFK